MPNPWFRMYSEFATDPKVQRLSETDQRRFVMLLCLRCSNDDETLHDDDVTFSLRISDEEWRTTKAILQSKNLIDQDNKPCAWNKRQYASDSSTARVVKHREQHKKDETLQKRKSNVPDTDTETESEKTNTSLLESAAPKSDFVPFEQIVNLYHETLPKLPRVRMLTKKRKGQIAARWKSGNLPDLDTWKNFFVHVGNSKFLIGGVDPPAGGKRFVADLEWITNESNFTKIWEGKYHGQQV